MERRGGRDEEEEEDVMMGEGSVVEFVVCSPCERSQRGTGKKLCSV